MTGGELSSAVPSTGIEGARCEICGEAPGTRPTVLCSRCGTFHHADCFEWNGGCSIYGCGGRRAEDPVDDSPAPYVVETPDHPLVLVGVFVAGGSYYVVNGVVGGETWYSSLFVGVFFGLAAAGLCLLSLMYWRLVHCRRLVALGTSGPVVVQHMLFGRPWGRVRPLDFNRVDVAELHLHVVPTRGGSDESLHVAFADGTRSLLYERSLALGCHVVSLNDLRTFAERLAAHTGATVRILRTSGGPSPRDVKERLALRDDVAPPVALTLPEATVETVKGKEVSSRKRAVEPTTCPSCRGLLTVPVSQCRRCRTVVHRMCWDRHGGCPIEGCGGRLADEPWSPHGSTLPFTCTSRPTFSWWNYLALVVVPLVVLGRAMVVDGALVALVTVVYFLISCTTYVMYALLCLCHYSFVPDEGRVALEYRIGPLPVWRSARWRMSSDLVAVHHHWVRRFARSHEEVWVAWNDGSRSCVYRQSTGRNESAFVEQLGSEEVERLTERLAAFGGCTVRFVRSDAAPPALPSDRG